MSSEMLKEVMRKFYEAFNKGDIDALDEIVDDSFVEHNPLPPRMAPNREGFKKYLLMFRNAFPDIQFDIQDIVAEGDKVWTRVMLRGTQREDFIGIPATGRPVETCMVDICRIKQNKMVEHWGVMDQLAMMQQMGMILSNTEPDPYF